MLCGKLGFTVPLSDKSKLSAFSSMPVSLLVLLIFHLLLA